MARQAGAPTRRVSTEKSGPGEEGAATPKAVQTPPRVRGVGDVCAGGGAAE